MIIEYRIDSIKEDIQKKTAERVETVSFGGARVRKIIEFETLPIYDYLH